MNFRDLNYLVAVAETKHFGKAAERCFVSQPTLSMQLKKLERELGLDVFERDNKHVFITPAGESVVAQAREVLRHVEALRNMARHAHDPFSGPFRMGVIPTLGPYLLPHILKPITKALPSLNLLVSEDKTDHILKAMREGRLDAAILALPVQEDGLVSEDLFSEPFYVSLPAQHRLAKSKSVSMRDLKNEKLLLLEEGHCLRDQAIEACQFSLGSDISDFRATSLETIRHLVGAGAGITFLPALAVPTAEQDPAVVIKSFSGSLPARRIGILWRKSSVRVACCEKVMAIVKKALAKNRYLKLNRPHDPMRNLIST